MCGGRKPTAGTRPTFCNLLIESRFPRLWTPSAQQRDLRQLLIHRHKLVEIRTRVKNGLQHLMLNRGVQKKNKLWSQAGQQALRELPPARLEPHSGGRICSHYWPAMNEQIGRLDQAAETAAGQHRSGSTADDAAGRGSDHFAGVCLHYRRCHVAFRRGKQVASYLGLIPREHSSGGRQKLGAISKQGNRFVTLCCWWKRYKRVTRLRHESFRKQYPQRCQSHC